MSERLVVSPSRDPEKPDVSGLTSDLGQAALLLAAETTDAASVNGSVRQTPAANRDQEQSNKVSDETIPTQRTQSTTNKRKPLSDEHKAKPSETNKGENSPSYGKKHSPETKAKMSAAQKARSEARKATSRLPAKTPWQEMMTQEEKLTALLPRLGPIERQIVVRSWGRDGHAPQSVDEITRQLFQGAPIWGAKVRGTIRAVQRLISGLEYSHQPFNNNRDQTSQGDAKPNQS